MIDEIILIYNNLEDRDIIDNIPTSRPIALSFYDYGSRKEKRKARMIMEEFGARQLPFAILKENDKVVKCLYTEDKNKVILNLKEYL